MTKTDDIDRIRSALIEYLAVEGNTMQKLARLADINASTLSLLNRGAVRTLSINNMKALTPILFPGKAYGFYDKKEQSK